MESTFIETYNLLSEALDPKLKVYADDRDFSDDAITVYLSVWNEDLPTKPDEYAPIVAEANSEFDPEYIEWDYEYESEEGTTIDGRYYKISPAGYVVSDARLPKISEMNNDWSVKYYLCDPVSGEIISNTPLTDSEIIDTLKITESELSEIKNELLKIVDKEYLDCLEIYAEDFDNAPPYRE